MFLAVTYKYIGSIMIEKWDRERWGELNERNMRKKLESEGYEVYGYVYSPGTQFADHSHGVDKKDSVLSGKFKLVIEGKSFILEAGDMIEVKAGVIHSAEVIGNEPVVSLDATRR
jgi:quercetin dioxygenase-like cupin family protein